ncbi:MAG: hypothetical protein JWN75_769 [Candidatus Saccharibacteria bacterium]|nr:hypothetical protein [Candidatus Saccharibacteria bacterium]
MDEGPFRMPRSPGRSADSQPPEEPIAAIEEPKPVHRPIAHRTPHLPEEKKSKKKLFIAIAVAVVIVLAGVGGWAVWNNMNNSAAGIDASKYQAVFLSNGQSYFGKLHPFNDKYYRLTDVYYLQTQQATTDTKTTQTTTDQNNVQLIKLGDELHGPQDEMVISKDQILFYENLKPDGKVSQSITKFKKS